VEAGVTAVPPSAFYIIADAPRHFARFCLCKNDSSLDAALERLSAHFRKRR
jgi:aspartate/methionine/tyrosine aminotransferase